PWGNRIEIVSYDNVQFTKAPNVLWHGVVAASQEREGDEGTKRQGHGAEVKADLPTQRRSRSYSGIFTDTETS
ncbi:MAG: hypothetical protein WBE94_03975, partial [Pseudolabrys sp.]